MRLGAFVLASLVGSGCTMSQGIPGLLGVKWGDDAAAVRQRESALGAQRHQRAQMLVLGEAPGRAVEDDAEAAFGHEGEGSALLGRTRRGSRESVRPGKMAQPGCD